MEMNLKKWGAHWVPTRRHPWGSLVSHPRFHILALSFLSLRILVLSTRFLCRAWARAGAWFTCTTCFLFCSLLLACIASSLSFVSLMLLWVKIVLNSIPAWTLHRRRYPRKCNQSPVAIKPYYQWAHLRWVGQFWLGWWRGWWFLLR